MKMEISQYFTLVIQLLSTSDEVAKLQEELEQMKPLLADAVQESIFTMQRISEDTVCYKDTQPHGQHWPAKTLPPNNLPPNMAVINLH